VKIFNNISKEKAQRILFIAVLILVFGVFFISLSLLGPGEDSKKPDDNNPPGQNDDNDDDGNEDIVIYEVVKAPYKTDQEMKVVRKFWTMDVKDEEVELVLIQFGSSYYTSNGISYARTNGEQFDVVASLSGKVVAVQEDSIYGKTVTIEHNNKIKTEYLSLDSVNVKVGDTVKQGDVIGRSGANEFDASAGNHLHFRFMVNNKYVNPELVFNKATNQITL